MADDEGVAEDARTQRTLQVAERVASLLEAEGGGAVVIGALALAVHGYARATSDLDLATAVDPFSTLLKIERACAADGLQAKLIPPDADDPLGGVLTVGGSDFDTVQVVNFYNPLRPATNPGMDAIEHSEDQIQGTTLRVASLRHVVALKLYAGGLKSRADVLALLEANPDTDHEALRKICDSYGLLRDLEAVLRELSD